MHALARVQVRAWLHAYSGFPRPRGDRRAPVEAREPQWRTASTDPENPATTVVWDQDGTVAGFADHGPARDEDLDECTGELYALYVDPPAQGAGVGRALLADAIDAAGRGRLRARGAVDLRGQRPGARVLRALRVAADAAAPPHPDHWAAPSVGYVRDAAVSVLVAVTDHAPSASASAWAGARARSTREARSSRAWCAPGRPGA